MKLAICVLAGLVIGFGLGWYFSPGRFRHHYRSSQELQLANDQGVVIGKLPAGTPLISDSELFSSADFGWWGYAPVYFSTMGAAVKLGVQPGKEVTSITEMPLNVVVDFERVYADEPPKDASKR